MSFGCSYGGGEIFSDELGSEVRPGDKMIPTHSLKKSFDGGLKYKQHDGSELNP